MKSTISNITMLERTLNRNFVAPKSRKSDKMVVIRMGATVSVNVTNKR